MGQEAYIGQRSGKRGASTVSVGGSPSDFNRSSPVLSEELFGGGLDAVELLGILPVQPTGTSVFTEVLIRGLDIIGAVIMLLLAVPVMFFTAVLVKITSPGPVLYKQKRVGKNGRIFTLYKFRTMVNHAEKVWGFIPATQDDERVTPIGKFLRRTHFDELPQLINVMKGEMSLVGPRPENVYRVNMHASLRGARLLVKPGITGLAQIRALYDLRPEHKLKYDYLYIQKRSFFLNAYILLQTIPVVLLRKGW